MTNSPGHPTGPHGGDGQDASYWWLDDEAAMSSQPSDTRMRLDRLRHDVNSAPDLSARILGQAGRHEVFVPRSKRHAIRAMRWGGALAAAMLLGLTLWTIHRTPAGEVLRADAPTPVTDIVSDIQGDAERVRENVLGLTQRVRSSNSLALKSIDAQPPSPRGTAIFASITTPQVVADFSPEMAVTWSGNTAFVTRYQIADVSRPIAPLGVGGLVSAFDAIALALETHAFRSDASEGLRQQAVFGAALQQGIDSQQPQAGFFAGEPDSR